MPTQGGAVVADSSSEVMEPCGAAGDAVPGDVAGMHGSGTRLKGCDGQITGPCASPLEEMMGFGLEQLQVHRGVEVAMEGVGCVGFAPAGPRQWR